MENKAGVDMDFLMLESDPIIEGSGKSAPPVEQVGVIGWSGLSQDGGDCRRFLLVQFPNMFLIVAPIEPRLLGFC